MSKGVGRIVFMVSLTKILVREAYTFISGTNGRECKQGKTQKQFKKAPNILWFYKF